MNIARNLQYLRKRDRITQEDLADKLDVSRQSVSKWETGEAYPETEKLLALCDLFNVSLDELMRGDVSLTEIQPQDEQPIQPTDVKTYRSHMNKFSRGIALGVALILFGVALCVALAGVSFTLVDPYAELTSVMSGAAVIVFVAPALFLFVFNGITHERFQKAHPVIQTPPESDSARDFSKRFAIAMALLVSGILLDVVFLVVFTSLLETGIISVANADAVQCYVTAVFLAVLGGIVSGIVHFGMQRASYNIEEYSKQARAALNPSPRDKLTGTVCGIIMMSATALFLVLGFVCSLWHPAWVVFPVGGILCGIVSAALHAKTRDK